MVWPTSRVRPETVTTDPIGALNTCEVMLP